MSGSISSAQKNHIQRIGALDGLRALAIWMVFNVHFLGWFAASNYFVPPESMWSNIIGVLRAGHLGVDLFFVTSAYLIYRALRGKAPRFVFFKKRIYRLLPAHLVVLIYIALRMPSLNLEGFLINVAFLAPIVPGIPVINEVTWSLTWEWFFYIFIFVAVLLSPRSEVTVILILLALSVAIAIIESNLLGLPPSFYFGRYAGFLIGVALVCFQSSRHARMRPQVIGMIAVAAFVIIITLQMIWSLNAGTIQNLPLQGGFFILASLAFAAIIFSALNSGTWVERLFSIAPLQYMGRISYSFYLVHSIVIGEILNRFPAQSISGVWLRYLIVFSATIAIASAMYYLFERSYFTQRRSNVEESWTSKRLRRS